MSQDINKALADALRQCLEKIVPPVTKHDCKVVNAARTALAACQQAEPCIFPACQHNGCREQCKQAEAQPVAEIQNGSLAWHIPHPGYAVPVHLLSGCWPLYLGPQPQQAPIGAIREVIRISDRTHPAWDAVKLWLASATGEQS